MLFLLLQACFELVRMEVFLLRRDFPGLHEAVRDEPLRPARDNSRSLQQVCSAVDIVCVCYWKPVFCLQRAALTTIMLRRHGVPAEMVLGVQQVPFRAHAWVEVDGRVVNDRPYISELYSVLDRC